MKSNPVLRRRSFGHSIEPLEARIAPATLAILSGGNISVLGDQGGAGEIETLTFTVSGSDLHIADPTHAITAGAGFTQSGANEVFIALSSLTGNLTVNTGTGADALALSSNLSLPGDATFTSGGTLTFNNSLTLAANKNLTGSAGTISVNGAIGFGGGLQLTATGGGLDVAANLTKAAGGNATATLKATTDVRFTSGADLSVTSGALALTLNPDTDGNQAGGVLLDTGTTIDTNGGALTIGGGATPGTTPTGGVVVGPNPGIGVDLEGAAVSTGAGLIHIRALGTGSGHGVGIMSGSSLTTTTGAIDIVGTGGNGTGGVDGVRIALANSTVTSSGGDIAITGTANAADQGTGVMVGQQGSIRNTGTGGISLTGTGSATAANSLNNYGVFITRGSGVTINGGGNISILATAGVDSNAFGAGAGGLGIARLGFDGTNVFSGNISITVAEFGTTDSLGLGIVTVASTGGALTIQPLSPATTIGVGGGAGVLDVSAGDFGTLSDGFGSITIGRSNGTGAINVGPITFSDPVTLRNPGAGAGGIAFNGAVTANEGLVATSAGTVTVGATLTAGGASAIQLTGQDVTGSGDIATGGGLTVSNTGIGSTLSGVISGSAAPLTKLGAGTLTLAGANTYTGTTTINAGTLLVTGSLADGAAATDVTVAAGATLGGTGTIGGAVNNSGTVQPGGVAAAGTLTIAGGYTQVAGGTLAIELGGTAGAQFDHLSVGGTATLGGSLNATLINGFNPPFGSQFAVLTASPRTGTFSTVSGPVTAQYNPNNVTLVGPQLFTWDGSAADGNWFNAANWDLNAVPGAIDSAILGISSSINLTSDVQVGFFNQSTGTLTGSAALTVLSGLTWTGGTMSGSGVTHANGGLVLSGGDVILDTRTFDLPAGQTATLSGGANSLGFQNGAHFNNAGTFLVQNNGSFSGGGSAGTFSNTGTFTRNTATGTFAVGVPFDNTGTVNVQTGTVTFSVGSSLATTTGDFNVSSGAILRWSSNFNLGAASDVAGAGTVNFSSGTINVAGTYNLSGAGSASTFTGATVNFNATIASLGAGPLAISSGSVVSFNSNDLIVPSINLVSGTLGGTLASLTSSGLITWSGGTMSGSGVTHANGGLLLGGGDVILNTRTFDLPAGQTATLSGGANSLGLQNGAHFNNAGTFLVQNNASFSDNGGGAGTISNTGTFTRNTAAGVFTIGVPFDNTGTVNVQTGTLSFSAGSSLATTTGDFNVSSGATLRWSSSFNLGAASDVAGAGTVNFSSGTINVAGTYNLTGAGSASTFTGATVNFNATIASLGAGALAISSGSVVIFNSNDLTVPSINLASGTLGGTIASLSSSGLITWSGGRMSGSGVTHANGGLLLGGGDVILDTRTFDLPAGQTATLSGAGNSLGLQNGAHFNNAGTFLVQNNASFFDNGGSAGAFTNTGTFTRNTTAGVFAVGVPFDNTGTVNVQTGTLRFSAGSSLATTTGDFNVSSGAILRWSSNFNLGAASDVAGAGTVDFSSGTINVAGTYNLTGAGSASTFTGGTVNFNATIASLGAGALSISSGSVVSFNSNDLTVPSINLASGTLGGTLASLTSSGLITWSGGRMSGSGVTHANGGLLLGVGDVILDTRTFDLPAGQTATLSGAGNSLGLQNGAHFNNAGTFLVQNNASFFDNGGSAGTFSNSGTFTRNTTTGVFGIGVPFDNTGTVNVQTGTLRFSAGSSLATTTGDFNVSSGATLRWSSSFNLGAASDVAGAGTVDFSNGTINVAGTYNLTGAGSASTFTGGTVNFNATIASLGAGALSISSGSVVSFNSNDLTVPSINLASGTLGGTLASLTSSGLITWSGGRMSGSGVTHANGGLLLGGGDVILDTRTFDLPAGQTATLSGAGNSLGLQNGAHFNNAGTFLAQNSASFFDNGGSAGTFSNSGTFTRNTASGVFAVGVSFDNTGTVNVQSGTLRLSAGGSSNGTFAVTVAGALDFQAGTYAISGTVNGNVSNSGSTFNLGGSGAAAALNVTGNYTQGAGATLAVELGGTVPGTQYDQLTVGGTATLAGTLNATLLSGFTPAGGSTFQVVTAAPRSGTFTTTNVPSGFTVQNNTNNVTLLAPLDPLQVNTTADVVNAGDSFTSLREAITFANGNAGLDTITFAIPGGGVQTIAPTSALPAITQAVVIDGYTQPGAAANTNGPLLGDNSVHLIVLDGGGAGNGVNGLTLASNGSTIRGLVIDNFQSNGSAGEGLVISGNNNTVEGSFIGTNAAGATAIYNERNGILVTGANNTIGGTAPAARNVLVDFGLAAVQITGAAATGNLVVGNFIGTDRTGTASLGTASIGVSISDAHDNTIGGTTAAARNIISGNSSGIWVIDTSTTVSTTFNNVVRGNFIGTDVTGTLDLGNTSYGIRLLGNFSVGGVFNNTVGGLAAGAGNVISGNGGAGITIEGGLTTGNLVQGNFIGTDRTGTAAIQNDLNGVDISGGADANTIGGTASGARNIISNNASGITLNGVGINANVIQGNYIGTDVTGTIDLGNRSRGISIGNATNTLIGGSAAGAGNLISGNAGEGIFIFNAGTTATIQGNLIGTAANGTSTLGNDAQGILVTDANGVIIGGPGAGEGNRIAFNNLDGVNIINGSGNVIRGNSIHSNVRLGINLVGGDLASGVTPNDLGDGDTGSNGLQNFPVVTSATRNGAVTTINTTLNSAAGANFTIDFYASTAADPSGFGEGQVYLGSTNVATDGSGNVSFSFNPTTQPAPGSVITATATSTTNSTSEFSQTLALATVFTWDGDAGNPDQSWFNPINWDLDSGFPGAADIAILNIAKTIALPSSFSVGTFQQSSGTMTGSVAATFTVLKAYDWSAGLLAISTNIAASATLTLSGAAAKPLDGRTLTVQNGGTAQWSGTGDIQLTNNATINNSGTFLAQNSASILRLDGSNPAFNNLAGGLFSKTGAGTTTISNTVPFSNAGAVSVATAGATIDFGSLSASGGASFAGPGVSRAIGNFSVAGATTITGGAALELAGGTMSGTGTFTGTGNFNFTSGTIGAALTIASGNTALVSGDTNKTLNNTLTISSSATVQWSGLGDFQTTNNATINNSGTFLAQSSASLVRADGSNPTFNNLAGGLFSKTGSGTTAVSNAVAFNNAGTVSVSTAGAVMDFGNLGTSNGAAFTGPGVTRATGSFGIAGTTTIAAGAMLELAGGAISGTGTFAGTGNFNFTSGSIGGGLTIANGSTALISGASNKTLDAVTLTIQNGATVQWSGLGDLQTANNATINNSGAFLIQNSASLARTDGSSPTFNNAGTLAKTAGAGTSTITGLTFSNTGLIDAQIGTLAFANGYTQTAGTTQLSGGALGAGPSLVLAGGVLTGAGNITGNVNNTGGTVRPGGTGATGTLAITGTYTQGAGGTLAAELGGTGAAQFDVLSVSGTATLDGTLNATLINGFVPATGTSFAVLTAAPRSGSFTTTNVPSGFTVQNNPNNVTLVAPASAVFTWDSGAGADQSWFNPLNWDLDSGFPGSTDVAILSNGGTINLASNASVAVFQQSNGTLDGAGTLDVLTNFAWSGGTQSGSGATMVGSAGTLTLNGAGTKTLSARNLINDGTASFSGGNLGIAALGLFTNNGVFNATDDADILNSSGGATFSNSATGTFNKSGAGTTTLVAHFVTFNSAGAVNVTGGTLQFEGDGTSSVGTFTISSGGVLEFNSPNDTYTMGAAVTGAGNVIFTSANANLNGSYSVTGTTTVNTNAAANFNGTASITTLNVAGTLGGSGAVTVSGALNWTGGTIGGSNTFTVANGATFNVSGAGSKTLSGRTLVNNTPVSPTGGNLQIGGGGTFTNNSVFNTASGVDILNAGGGGTFSNAASGTFNKSSAGTTTIGDFIALTNAGTVNVTSGTLVFGAAGTFTQTAGSTALSGGSITIPTLDLQGGDLRGAGTITGNVNNSGATVRPGGTGAAGTLAITGNYTQGTGGTLAAEIGGISAGQFDVLDVTGTVSLGGTLTLASLAGFTPPPGQAFPIAANDASDAITGTFAGLAEGATISNFLGSGLNAVITYQGGSGGNDVVITTPGGGAQTMVALNSGNLSVLGSDNNDALTLSLNGANLRVTDTTNPITAGAGAVQVDANTVEVLLASVTGNVSIAAGLGVDSVTLAAGLPPLNGLTIFTESLAALPALTVNGAVSLASTDTNLTQTAPLSVTGTASFAVGAHSITLTNPGNDFTGAVSLSNSGLNAISIIDPNALTLGASNVGTGTLSATAGTALTVVGAISFGGDLNLTTTGADQPLSVQGALTKVSGGDAIALLKATGDVRFENSGGLTVSAPGLAVTLNADSDATGGGGVFIDTGSMIVTNGGNVTIGGGASPGTTATGGLVTGQIPGGTGINYGVEIVTGSAINAGAGNVLIRGHGRDGVGTFAVGLEVQGSVTTTTGSITLVGTGGNTTSQLDSGVQILGLVESTADGSISITGTGAGSGQGNRGVNIGGGTVRTTGAGSITLTGTGSATGTGTANYGVDVQSGGAVTIAGSGGITINAISGAGSAAFHTLTGINRVGFDGTNPYLGAIALNADSMSIDNAAIQTTGTVTLRPRTNGALIDLGGADAAGTLGLTDAELDQMTAGTVQIGDSNSGAITVSAALTPASDLSLTTGAGITFNDAVTMAVNKSFTASALGTTTGAINFATANADLAASGAGAISLTTARNIALAGGSSITTVNGALTLVADQMSFDATSTISAQGGVTLAPRTVGTAINLGSTVKTTPGTLELSDAELDRVTAGRINLGGSNSGAITVSAAITRPAPTTLALLSGAGMVNLDALLDTGGGTILFAAGTYRLGASNLIADTTTIDVHGGAFDLGAFNDTVQGVILDGGRIIGSGMLTSATAFDVRSGRIDARLGGTMGLVKSSPGTVILGNAQNSFTGTVSILAGILQVAADGALGAAANPLTIGNATLRTTATFNSPRAITLSGPATFDVVSATTLTLTGAVTGPSPLVQTGGGTLVVGYTFTKDDSSITIVSGSVNVGGSIIALGGTGTAVVKKGPGPNQIQSIELSGTTEKTSLSVKSPAGIITEIAKIISANPADSIGKIVLGKGVRFGDGLAGVASDPAVADMAIAGKLGKLTFDGVSANTLVTLGKGLPYNANPANPADPTPDTYNHKPELKINQVLGAGVTFDLTPARDGMGAYVRDEFGNLLGGGGFGKVTVAQWGLDNGTSFPGVIKTTQSITSFILKKGDCGVTFEVDKERVGATTPGNVGTIKVLTGSWTSAGNVIDGYVGIFDVGGFTVGADLRADYIQKKFLIRGTFTDINGVAYGGTTILDQDLASGAFNISVGDFSGKITATGAIGKFVANGTFSGALTAKSILSVTADEFVKIGPSSPLIKSTGGAIGAVTTKFGGIANTTIESSTNIGKIISKGAVMGSRILAGADPDNNGNFVLGDPTATGTIGALTIAGALEASTIAARTLDALTFRYPQAATAFTVLPGGASTTLIALQSFTTPTLGLKVGTAPAILNATLPAVGHYYFTFLAGTTPLGTIHFYKSI